MIELKIGKQKATLPNQWSEMTLNRYKGLVKIVNNNEFHEPPVDDLPTTEDGKEALEMQRQLHNIRTNKKVFSYLTGVNETTIDKCNMEDMNSAMALMNEFLNSQAEKSYKQDTKYKFSFKGKTYYFPDHNMEKSTFGDYIESAQLDMFNKKSEGGRMSVLAEQMAILCREKNEVYDEQIVMKKTKLFGNLTMDVVWDFLFFLMERINTYKKNIPMSLKMATETKTDTPPNIGK